MQKNLLTKSNINRNYRREIFQRDKGLYKNPTANIILNEGRLNAFCLRSGIKQECSLTTLPPEVSSQCNHLKNSYRSEEK